MPEKSGLGRAPSGEQLTVEDYRLIELISEAIREGESLDLFVSHRAMTDCHPLSLFSIQTTLQLGAELGIDLDGRRFRADIYLDLESNVGLKRINSWGTSYRSAPRPRWR